jgi:hypothetical protein
MLRVRIADALKSGRRQGKKQKMEQHKNSFLTNLLKKKLTKLIVSDEKLLALLHQKGICASIFYSKSDFY